MKNGDFENWHGPWRPAPELDPPAEILRARVDSIAEGVVFLALLAGYDSRQRPAARPNGGGIERLTSDGWVVIEAEPSLETKLRVAMIDQDAVAIR